MLPPMRLLLLAVFCCLVSIVSNAQRSVGGRVFDGESRQPLAGATIAVTPDGGGRPRAVASDAEGRFEMEGLGEGRYAVMVSFMGYRADTLQVSAGGANVDLGRIVLIPVSNELGEVEAAVVVRRQEQRGDTTIFNAAAFKVNPNATTEDLIKKMPGMQVKDGSIEHGGERVRKVLVDGKEFFGDDPMIAVRNIDANMVDKIEVFDKQSEQSQFTGFNDGNEERTLNILTKTGVRGARFGQFFGGYGTDGFYEAGVNVSSTTDLHRVSLLGGANNVGKMGFAAYNDGGGGGSVGDNRVASGGVNYVFNREGRLSVETSYFFNRQKTRAESQSHQEYFQESDADPLRVYDSRSESDNSNRGHRANLRLKWDIDTLNSMVFAPRFNWQGSDSRTSSGGEDVAGGLLFRSTGRTSDSDSRSYSAGGDLTLRHRFAAPRRTISLRLGSNVSNSDSDANSLNALHSRPGGLAADTAARELTTSQKTQSDSRSTSVSARLAYTEPLGRRLALQAAYSAQVSLSSNDRQVWADSADAVGEAAQFADYRFSRLLSNKKSTRYTTHRAGLDLNFSRGRDFRASVGLDVQDAILDGDQAYPVEFETRRSFFSVMPTAELHYRRGRTTNLRLTYRTSSSAPSVSQLQNVVDVSNIRRYGGGNENLRQSVTHSLRMHGAANSPETSRFVFVMASMQVTSDYIATASYIAAADSVIDHGIVLPAGTEYTKPVNLDGSISANVNVNGSTPVGWLGSNLNASLGLNISKRPSLYNGARVTSRTSAFSVGLNLGSSFSENLDFNLGYDASYNVVKSTMAAEADYNYYRHAARANINCNFFSQRLFVGSDIRHNFTSGMDSFDSNYLTWNAEAGGRFFKGNRGELRLRVNDILNNSESRNRSVQDASVVTSSSNVIRRYAMLTFVYRIRSTQGGDGRRLGPGRRPGGFGGPGGPPPGGRVAAPIL